VGAGVRGPLVLRQGRAGARQRSPPRLHLQYNGGCIGGMHHVSLTEPIAGGQGLL
jgi:hypothetical protein